MDCEKTIVLNSALIIKEVVENKKYEDFCKSISKNHSNWSDLYQDFRLIVLELKDKILAVENMDTYCYSIINGLWKNKGKKKTHNAPTNNLYQISDNLMDWEDYRDQLRQSVISLNERELKIQVTQELNVLLKSNNEQIRTGAEYLRIFIEGKNRLKISQELGVNYRIVHESIENTINIIKAKVTGKTYMTKTEIQITLRNEGVSKVSYSGKTKTFYVDKLPATGIVKEVESAGFKVVKNV